MLEKLRVIDGYGTSFTTQTPDFRAGESGEDVLNLQDANTCPHGRPLFVSYQKSELEKQFKRIT